MLLISQTAGTAIHLVSCQRAEPDLTAPGHFSQWAIPDCSYHTQVRGRTSPRDQGVKKVLGVCTSRVFFRLETQRFYSSYWQTSNQTTSKWKNHFLCFLRLSFVSAKAKLFAWNIAVLSSNSRLRAICKSVLPRDCFWTPSAPWPTSSRHNPSVGRAGRGEHRQTLSSRDALPALSPLQGCSPCPPCSPAQKPHQGCGWATAWDCGQGKPLGLVSNTSAASEEQHCWAAASILWAASSVCRTKMREAYRGHLKPSQLFQWHPSPMLRYRSSFLLLTSPMCHYLT